MRNPTSSGNPNQEQTKGIQAYRGHTHHVENVSGTVKAHARLAGKAGKTPPFMRHTHQIAS
jgi:hypothetical protein